MAQLSAQGNQLFEELSSIYGERGVDANRKTKPLDVEEMIDIILRYSQLQQKIFIAIDAVNEASEPLTVLKSLQQLTLSRNIHIIMSSVKAPGMEEFLQTVPCLAIETLGISDIQGDVDLYVRSFLESDYRMRAFPARLKEEIVTKLTVGTQGM